LSEVVASPVQNPSEAFRRTYPHTGGFRVRSEREKQPPGGTHDIAGNQHLLAGYPNFQYRLAGAHALETFELAQCAIDVAFKARLITEQAIWLRRVRDTLTKRF